MTVTAHAPRRRADCHCPFMPTYRRRPPVMFVRGDGTELWDADGQAATSTSCPGSP